MASKQVMNEVITRAVAETTRVTTQTMVEAQAERRHDVSGPKIGSPVMRKLMFHWNAEVKYSELKHSG